MASLPHTDGQNHHQHNHYDNMPLYTLTLVLNIPDFLRIRLLCIGDAEAPLGTPLNFFSVSLAMWRPPASWTLATSRQAV